MTPQQRRRYAVERVEQTGCDLVYEAQRFNPQNSEERRSQTRSLYRVAREYAAAVRCLARLRA